MNKVSEIGVALDKFNVDNESYEILTSIFIQFDNNTRNKSHMELFALAIEAVRREIESFKTTMQFPTNKFHIEGLNDYSPIQLYNFLTSINSLRDNLMEIIGFTSEDIAILQEMIFQIARNEFAKLEEDFKSIES